RANVYPGMTATVSIIASERLNAILAPTTALSFVNTALQNGEITRTQLTSASGSSSTSTTSGTSTGVVIELVNGKLTPVKVVTGLASGNYTEIISGLKVGDKVVTAQTGGTTTTSSSSS